MKKQEPFLKALSWVVIHLTATLAVCGVLYAEAVESIDKEGVVFGIQKAQYILDGEFDNLDLEAEETFPSPPRTKRDALAITFELYNGTNEKKFDLAYGFEFLLADEFGNEYRQLGRPLNYAGPTHFFTNEYPSFYPGDRYVQTVFFEAPLRKSQHMLFVVNALQTGFKENATLRLPQGKIQGVDDYLNRRVPNDNDLKIISPREGTHVRPGDIVFLKVTLSADLTLPESLFIITPQYVLEDKDLNFKYDLRIPPEQEPGPMVIVVMAKWNEHSRFGSISRSFILDVQQTGALSKF